MYIYTYIFMQPSITAATTSVSAAPPPTEAFVPCENYLKIKKRVRGHFLGYIQAHVQMATMRCVASLHALRCITASTTLHRCIKQLPQPLPRCPPWPTQAKAFVLSSTGLSYLTRLSTGGIILRCGGTSPVGNRAVEERMISRSKNEFVGLHTSAFRELRWPQCALQ